MNLYFCYFKIVGIIFLLNLNSSLGLAQTQTQTQATASALGAAFDSVSQNLNFRIYSAKATHIEVYMYKNAMGEKAIAHLNLVKNLNTQIWSAKISKEKINQLKLSENIFYGYRLWGPNWIYDSKWSLDSEQQRAVGFQSDVDSEGNRFNPNKLLLDPYALEISHDPLNLKNFDYSFFQSGADARFKDSELVAPKGIVFLNKQFSQPSDSKSKPQRAFKDEIIYEVHLRGLTKNDMQIPQNLRGTYKGAALKAAYLKKLGVTAVEFLPVQESQNDLNDFNADKKSAEGVNYWGYMTINYFSPDRRFAFDQTPGGPTKEFKQMTEAFHAAGIKVYLDVVYNHTFEGGLGSDTDKADLISYRGIDNSSYYLLSSDHKHYWENTGTGNNLNTAQPVVRNLILDSLKYWKNKMGVDGFRFDLAPVLGNSMIENGFSFNKFDSQNALNRLVKELPVRPDSGGEGADLIAEPWTTSSYNIGEFPWGWAEWNGSFRDIFRQFQNKSGVVGITPSMLAQKFVGSSEIFQNNGRKPWHSVNFMDAHDGFTLADIFKYNSKNNFLSWPYGSSDGGSDNNDSWDQNNNLLQQRQSARNAMVFLALSAGVPMIQGGDEFLRTLNGNNNSYNLDNSANWLDWSLVNNNENNHFYNLTQKLFSFRQAHSSLRPITYFDGTDHNQNGLKDITWYTAEGLEPSENYWTNSQNRFLAYQIDASEFKNESVNSIYVATNGFDHDVNLTIPCQKPKGQLKSSSSECHWYRVSDTADWFENQNNIRESGAEDSLTNLNYVIHARSVLILIEK